MERIMERAERIAEAAVQRKVAATAGRLRERLGEAAVEIEEARVVMRGRWIVKRWLIDPSLRFLGGLK